MQCNKVKKKNTKLTSILRAIFLLSHSCSIKLPAPQWRVSPDGMQSASPAVPIHKNLTGAARGIRVGYEINKK